MNFPSFTTIIDRDTLQCDLCPHHCQLREGQTGACQVRTNKNGEIQLETMDRPIFLSTEPIEKKFVFHFQPGSQTLSLATAGCNLRCTYCINWRVSQRGLDTNDLQASPEQVIEHALSQEVSAIAFTYTEPTIFFEYLMAIAGRARQENLSIVVKSNGFMTERVLRTMAPYVDAINIDLKGWHSPAYQQVTGSTLKPVLENLVLARELGIWLEVTSLLVPGLNDSTHDLEEMSRFIANNLGTDTPWHLLRFFPQYRMQNTPATSQQLLQQAYDAGQTAGLRYIYCGDLSHTYLQTVCPNCHEVVIEREGLSVHVNHLKMGCCPQCGTEVSGHFEY